MQITSSSKGKDVEPMALAIHQLVNKLPTTMRTKNSPGIRIEEGKVIDYNYTGPILEKVLKEGTVIRDIPDDGAYSGIPVVVVPIKEENEVIGVVGIVDITKGIFSDLKQITRRPELIKPETQKGEFY